MVAARPPPWLLRVSSTAVTVTDCGWFQWYELPVLACLNLSRFGDTVATDSSLLDSLMTTSAVGPLVSTTS